MTGALLASAGVGAGLLLIVLGLWPGRQSLAAALSPLHASAGAAAGDPPARESGWRARLGSDAGELLAAVGIRLRGLDADLAITGKTREWLVAEKVLDGVIGLLGMLALAEAPALVGYHLPPVLVALVAAGFGIASFMVPDLSLRREAAEKRRAFRHATGAYLDLVAISLAGGAGAEEALRNALADGQGFAFERLRGAIRDARLRGVPPWKELGRLGRELDVRELAELADSLSLAGTEGATVRRSLMGKASVSRAHQLSEVETRATTVTDQMVVPLMVILVGYILFILYPALVRAVTGL